MKTNLLVVKSPKAVGSVSAQSNVQEAFLSNLSRLYVCFVIHVIFQNQGIYRTSATSNFILYLPLQAGISLQADISFFLYCMHKVTSLLHCATKEIRDV